MKARITKRVVDGLKGTGTEYFAWDPELKGFGVRVRPSGANMSSNTAPAGGVARRPAA
jgi:hypothetical protein